MKLENFNYHLPKECIARYPLEKRSDSRLLCVHENKIKHAQFLEIINLLREDDLLIFNDTKVIPARLFGCKQTGGVVEILVEKILNDQQFKAQIRASKSPKINSELLLGSYLVKIIEKTNQFYILELLDQNKTVWQMIESVGQIPLPPYLQRLPEKEDEERYQTIFAKHKGSVAAPTAGLHFDHDMMKKIHAKKIHCGYLTLHIGAGTFFPVRVSNIHEHTMHAENFTISAEVCEQVALTKAKGGRVIAVGTTSLRALESASTTGKLLPYDGETNIFIYPGFQFQTVDALITNLHLPASTLLMLVCAFGGYDTVMRAYQEAIANHYRFYSYGDAMWVERR